MIPAHVLVWLVALGLMGYAYFRWPVGKMMLGDHEGATLDILAIGISPLLGYALGLACVEYYDRSFVKASGITSAQIATLHKAHDTKEGIFLTITWTFVAIYAVGYYYAVWKFAHAADPTSPPVNLAVAAITGVTIGALLFFAVQYAAYVRMTKFLETAIAKLPKQQKVIRHLREAVFRGEQIFEPPGNVFVTIGITATFLGLAAALVNLDLPGLLQLSNDSTEADPAAAALALRSFVGCMGLALGVSMLGVMTAVAAQWLRGHGALGSTENLLGIPKVAPPASTASAGSAATAGPTPPEAGAAIGAGAEAGAGPGQPAPGAVAAADGGLERRP